MHAKATVKKTRAATNGLSLDAASIVHRYAWTRSAACPKHGDKTTEYVGVNEHGWIFSCSPEGDGAHYFIAEGPE